MKTISAVAIACCFPLYSAQAQTNPVGDAPTNDALAASVWPHYHGGTARQASTTLPGPDSSDPSLVQKRFSSDDPGFNIGTSPWHNISDKTYRDSASARTIWGSSLTHVYKYVVDGDTFQYADSWEILEDPVSIQWNFAMLPGGRVLVPAPVGMQSLKESGRNSFGRCTSTNNSTGPLRDPAALLVFNDGRNSNSAIRCEKKFDIRDEDLRAVCGLSRRFRSDQIVSGGTAIGTDVLFNGDIAIRVRVNEVANDESTRDTYVVILDGGLDDSTLDSYKACEKLDGESTNGVAILPLANDGSRMYVPTDQGIVELDYDPVQTTLTVTGVKNLPFRGGRTGTTPTILFGSDGSEWLISIDAKCAVQDPFSGDIACDQGADPATLEPSRLFAFKLPFDGLASDEILTRSVNLPDYINTVENSPSVADDNIVVANYPGYFPETTFLLTDQNGQTTELSPTELEKGVVKLSYRPNIMGRGFFRVDWDRDDIQMSNVTSISDGSGLTYGSGAVRDSSSTGLTTHYYGLELANGLTRFEKALGPAVETAPGLRDEIFDQGNANIILEDGSIIFAGGRVLVRVRD